MCNLYVMYYLEEGAAMNLNCPNEQDPSITRLLPADSDKPLPPNPDLELKAKPGHGGGSNRQSKKKVLSSTGKTVVPQSSISFISGYSFKARGKKTLSFFKHKQELKTPKKNFHDIPEIRTQIRFFNKSNTLKCPKICRPRWASFGWKHRFMYYWHFSRW